jgi:hypothetical protein
MFIFIEVLPRLPKDISIVVLKKKDQQNNLKHFMVNKNRVLKCLQFLCHSNPLYVSNNIKIDHSVIELLPENGIIQVQEINDKEDVNEVIDDIEHDKGAEIIENEENFTDIDEEVIKIKIAKKL